MQLFAVIASCILKYLALYVICQACTLVALRIRSCGNEQTCELANDMCVTAIEGPRELQIYNVLQMLWE